MRSIVISTMELNAPNLLQPFMSELLSSVRLKITEYDGLAAGWICGDAEVIRTALNLTRLCYDVCLDGFSKAALAAWSAEAELAKASFRVNFGKRRQHLLSLSRMSCSCERYRRRCVLHDVRCQQVWSISASCERTPRAKSNHCACWHLVVKAKDSFVFLSAPTSMR
jgi:hypothetical protein